MRTQPHKTHIIDDFIEEIDNLGIYLNITKHSALNRSDLVLVRKEVLSHIHEILIEAQRRLKHENDTDIPIHSHHT